MYMCHVQQITHTHTHIHAPTMAQALPGPTVLDIKAVAELKIKSRLFDMMKGLLLKRLTIFNSILNLELLYFSLKIYKCKNAEICKNIKTKSVTVMKWLFFYVDGQFSRQNGVIKTYGRKEERQNYLHNLLCCRSLRSVFASIDPAQSVTTLAAQLCLTQ